MSLRARESLPGREVLPTPGSAPVGSGVAAALALAFVVLMPGCRVEDGGPTRHREPQGEGGSASQLAPELEAMVFGSTAPCVSDADCRGSLCYFGACVGLLLVDQRWMQETVASNIAAWIEAHPAQREAFVTEVSAVAGSDAADTAYRARSLLALEAVGAVDALRAVAGLAEDPEDRIAGAAALALTRLGQPEGLDLAIALTDSRQPAVAIEALRALGRSRSPRALEPLLSMLGPDLDRFLVAAAVEALTQLGDARAIGPLVGFLDVAPEYLRHPVAAALRRLTGAQLGIGSVAWRGWMAEHPPPEPPRFVVRSARAVGEPFLPTP